MASNAENVSILWRHHVQGYFCQTHAIDIFFQTNPVTRKKSYPIYHDTYTVIQTPYIGPWML